MERSSETRVFKRMKMTFQKNILFRIYQNRFYNKKNHDLVQSPEIILVIDNFVSRFELEAETFWSLSRAV